MRDRPDAAGVTPETVDVTVTQRPTSDVLGAADPGSPPVR